MRMVGGAVVVLLLLTAAQAEVVCVRFKKDGSLSGALKVRTECKRREVQVDPEMLGLCCGGSTTTTTSTTTTIDTTVTTINPTTTSSTSPTITTSTVIVTTTTIPAGTTTTTMAGASTTTSMVVTTTVTSTVTSSSSTVTFVVTTSTSTAPSTVTTTSLSCPTITSTTLGVPGCGGSPAFCNGLCANALECIAVGGLECSCSGPIRPCGVVTNAGACGGSCPGVQVCGTTVNVGPGGCPTSFGCGCIDP